MLLHDGIGPKGPGCGCAALADGGEVSFPEYGARGFKPQPGGAVVFSCSLLHSVSRVTRGRRYAFLPFLYDDEAAKLRQANEKFLDDGAGDRA